MKRMVSYPWPAILAVGVFFVTLACLVFIYALSFDALQNQRHERLAMCVLLFLWILIAFFLAKRSYLAIMFKHFNDGIHCEGCGYSLIGNRSGKCPECGWVIPEGLWQGRYKIPYPQAPESRPRASGRKHWHLAVLLTLFLAVGSIVVVYIWVAGRQRPTVPQGFRVADGDFCFLCWDPESSMTDLDPNSIFVSVNGSIRVRLTFRSAQHRVVQSVGLTDGTQRPWLNADLRKGQYQVNHYPVSDSNTQADPDVTYLDSDGDSLLDERIDWAHKDRSCITDMPTWQPCVSAVESAPEKVKGRK